MTENRRTFLKGGVSGLAMFKAVKDNGK